MNENIGGFSIQTWKEIFSKVHSKEELEDILYFDLYAKQIETELANIDEDDEDAVCDVYNEKFDYACEAYEKIMN